MISAQVRMLVIFYIMACVVYIPMKVNRMVELMDERQLYVRAYPYNENHGYEHVVLCGRLRTQTVHRFLQEFCHSDHDRGNQRPRVLFTKNFSGEN